MRPTWFPLVLALVACNGEDTGDGDGDDTSDDTGTDTSDTDTGGDTDTDVNNNWTGDDNYGPAPTRAADQVIHGNLSSGSVPTSVSWIEAEPFYCGAAVGDSYTGAHVYHTYEQTGATDLYVRLTPDAGLDMSLLLIQRADGSTATPPASGSAPGGGGDCDAAYDSDGNPSQPEVTCGAAFTGYEYSVLIVVSGAEGLTSGAYQLEIWDNSYTGCVHPDGT